MHAKLYVEKSGTKIEIDRRVIDRIRFEWVGVIDSLAHISQRGIHCVRERVYERGLLVSSNYQGRAAMLLQVFGDGARPLRGDSLRGGACTTRRSNSELGCEARREPCYFAWPDRFAMVRHRAGAGRHALDGGEAVWHWR